MGEPVNLRDASVAARHDVPASAVQRGRTARAAVSLLSTRTHKALRPSRTLQHFPHPTLAKSAARDAPARRLL